MTTCNISEMESEKKSARIHYLEQQVRMMRNELRHIRKDLVPQEHLRRLRHLSDKLSELKTLLFELRNYKSLQQQQTPTQTETSLQNNNNLRQKLKYDVEVGYGQQQKLSFGRERNLLPRHQPVEERKLHDREDEAIIDCHRNRSVNKMNGSQYRRHEMHEEPHLPPSKQQGGKADQSSNPNFENRSDQQKEPHDENKQKVSLELNENTAFKTCKELMDEIKSPSAILGKYILRLQDFRTDPELRRKRLEMKQQEKFLQHQQKQNNEEQVKISHAGNETLNSFTKIDQPPTENLNDIKQSETQTNKCIIEAQYNNKNNKPIPPEVPRPIPQHSLLTETESSVSPKKHDYAKEPVITQKFTPEAQTDANEFFDLDMTRNTKICGHKNEPDLWSTQFTSTTPPSSIQESDSDSSLPTNLPLIHKNLDDVVYSVAQNIDANTVALTVVMETDNLYHINVSVTTTGQSLSCLYATEAAVQQAKVRNLFKNFLTFFVVNSDNTLGQKDHMLEHSFEFKRIEI